MNQREAVDERGYDVGLPTGILDMKARVLTEVLPRQIELLDV